MTLTFLTCKTKKNGVAFLVKLKPIERVVLRVENQEFFLEHGEFEMPTLDLQVESRRQVDLQVLSLTENSDLEIDIPGLFSV